MSESLETSANDSQPPKPQQALEQEQQQQQSAVVVSEQEDGRSQAMTVSWPRPLVEDFNDKDWPNLDDTDDNILNWAMKHKRLLVRTITWNLCAKPPPPKAQLQKSLLTKKCV
jgi:hypothetical protein